MKKFPNANNIRYLLKLAYTYSKKRVIHGILKQVISSLLWVFYSGIFVRIVLNTLNNEMPLSKIFISIGTIGGISILLQAYLYYCEYIMFPSEDAKLFLEIHKMIFKKSENVEISCFEDSQFYNNFTTALDAASTKISETIDNVGQVIGGLVGAIAAFAIIFNIDKFAIIFLFAPLIGNFAIGTKMSRIFNERYKDTIPFQRVLNYVNRVFYLRDYAKELRLTNIGHVLIRDYQDAVNGQSCIWIKYFNKSFGLGVLGYILSYMIIFEGILLYGSHHALLARHNVLSFDQMAVMTSVMVTASWILVRVINAINKCLENSLIFKNTKDFLDYKEKIPEDFVGTESIDEIDEIEFRNVSFSYTAEKKVIDDISFCIKKGMKVAFVGGNGAGKSTIIKLLLRLYDPTEGEILVNGIDIRKYKLQEYRQCFSCVFQDFAILPGSIRYNVLMGREGDDETVIQALKDVGMYEKVSNLKNGINSILTKEFDDDGVIFSGGEYQKIMVARTFSNKESSIAIFDEPSSALDPIAENQLFEDILRASKNKINILISHRLSCVKDTDKVFMCERGKLIESASHNVLMSQQGKYYEMYHIQQKKYYTIT